MVRTLASLLVLASLALIFSGAGEGAPLEGKIETSCEADSDCLAGPELSSCFRYCKKDECRNRSIKLCPALSKKQQVFPDCAVSVPCRRPVEIACRDDQCVAK